MRHACQQHWQDYDMKGVVYVYRAHGVACAALSTHAGRHQRALPDKRARRKPGWLDNTTDPKSAAQFALQQATGADVCLLHHAACCCCYSMLCLPLDVA